MKDGVSRRDASDAIWTVPVRARVLHLGERVVHFGGSASSWWNSDGVILGLQGTSLDLYAALFRQMSSKLSVGVWGHVLAAVNEPSRVDLALERWQMRKASHVFAYGQAGAEMAKEVRKTHQGVTAVMNTIDDEALLHETARISEADIVQFRKLHNIRAESRVFAYIGGLDRGKGTALLRDVLDEFWRRNVSVQLIVGGRGEEEALLDLASRRGQVIRLGRVGERDKALMGKVASLLIAPGRVGLLAIDSLIMKVPIVTVIGALHGPEVDYLRNDVSLFSGPKDASSLVTYILNLDDAIGSSAHTTSNFAPHPRLEDMVNNFQVGVLEMMK